VKKRSIVLAGLLTCLFPLPSVRAQQVKQICPSFTTVDTTITTTAETVVATSPACKVPRKQFIAVIKTSFTVTTGASSATYKVRIRRETVSGTALGDAIARTIQVAAGGTEEVTFMATDERTADLNNVIYVATIEIASAAADATVGEAFIEVMLL
jgi:hypothetical protein